MFPVSCLWSAFLSVPRNHQVLQEREKLVTRFIGLAKVGNKGNARVCALLCASSYVFTYYFTIITIFYCAFIVPLCIENQTS